MNVGLFILVYEWIIESTNDIIFPLMNSSSATGTLALV